ncbi:MAG: GatB/YqeY domain-containing protein [SAR324 cluster bacterium]|uniref:GatB/YqeY domain-containing protein n=1 Tax=SAR324 cluster bacterium TaxID=2024889 RepID=A0A7X9FQI5_9DELT|nr:GatB/YqeY domain-containing protein [SAR324 cluster bacterium]
MAIKSDLKEAMKQAMKAKEQARLDTIRMVLSAIQYEEMQNKVSELSEDQILNVLKREVKKRKEEFDYAEKASRPDLQEKLKVEISTIEAFLPTQLSAEKIEEILKSMKEVNPELNLGLAMKALKESYPGQYDSKLASEVARKVLG